MSLFVKVFVIPNNSRQYSLFTTKEIGSQEIFLILLKIF